jgi:hypothetical protein
MSLKQDHYTTKEIALYEKLVINEFLKEKLAIFGESKDYYTGAKWIQLWMRELEDKQE